MRYVFPLHILHDKRAWPLMPYLKHMQIIHTHSLCRELWFVNRPIRYSLNSNVIQEGESQSVVKLEFSDANMNFGRELFFPKKFVPAHWNTPWQLLQGCHCKIFSVLNISIILRLTIFVNRIPTVTPGMNTKSRSNLVCMYELWKFER